ncbi:hypothetical protein HK104_010714 [Borealophlyctis nickersoniae]|nr:hypothetical protein HK104_010714 [Borealophlyctis nickersoniae]
MVGPLAKLMTVPDPSHKWIMRERSRTSNFIDVNTNSNYLLVDGPMSPITVYEETLTIPFDSVVNSILSPAALIFAIVAFFFGSGRYKPYGYAHKKWYFRRRTGYGAERRRFNIYPATDGEHQTANEVLGDRLKASEELRELLLAEFLEVHESQTNVRNDGGANMGWAKVSDKVTEGEDLQLRDVRVEDC